LERKSLCKIAPGERWCPIFRYEESKLSSKLKISTAIKNQNFTAALFPDPYPSLQYELDLREAIKLNSLPLVSLVIDHCERLDPRDSYCQIGRVLHEAVEQDILPAVKFLVEAGLDINSQSLLLGDRFQYRANELGTFTRDYGDFICTPLGRVIYHNLQTTSEFILKKGASLAVTEPPLSLSRNSVVVMARYDSLASEIWYSRQRGLG
jgi:hypothetical protein